jgi:hypothetical protein
MYLYIIYHNLHSNMLANNISPSPGCNKPSWPQQNFAAAPAASQGPPVSSNMASWEIPKLNGGFHGKIICIQMR